MTVDTKKVLGAHVLYTGLKGLSKAAIVIGTPETTEPDHVLGVNPFTGEDVLVPVPDPGHVNLLVFSYSGISPRFNVPFRDQAFEALTEGVPEQAQTLNPILEAQGEVGYWTFVEDAE